MSPTNPVSLNLNVRGMGHSPTVAIKARCQTLKKEGRQIFDFGLGQSPFPVPRPVVEALRLAAEEKDYLPVMGLPQLREAVAEFHRRTNGIEASGSRVLVGPGSKELMFLLQIAFYGEIILRSPCWVSYQPQARIVGRHIQIVPTTFAGGWKITPDLLLAALRATGDDSRPRLLVLNYPMNPTGHTYSAGELEALAEIARSFRLIVLSDEIYGQLHFEGRHTSIARFCPERTIVSSGLSKWCGAGGWRLGTFLFPPELDWLQQAMSAVASETYTAVCAPIQHAAVKAFEYGPEIERYLTHVRRVLGALGRQCARRLQEADVRVHEPSGAFYLFPDFAALADRLRARGINSGEGLCERLLSETGVALLPGSSFARPHDELTARLSYVDFDGAAALLESEEQGLDTPITPEFLVRRCERVVEGVNRIVEWVSREG